MKEKLTHTHYSSRYDLAFFKNKDEASRLAWFIRHHGDELLQKNKGALKRLNIRIIRHVTEENEKGWMVYYRGGRTGFVLVSMFFIGLQYAKELTDGAAS